MLTTIRLSAGIAADIRDSIVTLLGPSPNVKAGRRPTRSDFQYDIEVQKSRLIAYRAKVVALINIFEAGIETPGNRPITELPARKEFSVTETQWGGESGVAKAAFDPPIPITRPSNSGKESLWSHQRS